jgi:dTDP-4-amino-4,6-dideoxygalactose transaminase
VSARLRVPMLDLEAQHAAIVEQLEAALARVVHSQRFVLGPEVEAFERDFADSCEVRFAVGCASGSDALLLALMALEIGEGDQVICPTYSFFATAGSIVRVGARPVWVDIDPASYNLDLEAARRAAARCTRLRAILPVDLFGQVADLEGTLSLAGDFGVPVIEDAAQSVGARDLQGRCAGSRSTLGCFSFYPSKNLGAFGDAGIVLTDDPDLADRLRLLRAHGAGSRYHHDRVGINSRLDALQAAVLRVKLEHLESWTAARRENAAYYDRAFGEAGAGEAGERFDDLPLPLLGPRPAPPPARHVYHQYVIRVPSQRRDPLRTFLEERGIATEVYYPLGLHQQPCFAHLAAAPTKLDSLSRAEEAARESLAIPVHPELTPEQLHHVAENVIAFLSSR